MRIALSAMVMACTLTAGAQAGAQTAPATSPEGLPDKLPFDVAYGAPIALSKAQSAIAAAVAESQRRGWKHDVAVLDPGGHLVAFARMDGSQLGSIAVAQHKARAAVLFRRDTKAFEDAVASGSVATLSIDGVIASRGGVPILEGGRIVGALGCSGGTSAQDEVVCKAGAAAVAN